MNKIIYYIVISILTLLSLLPLKIHYFFSDVLYFILAKIIHYRSATIHINLARSFPDKKYKEIKLLAKEYYHFMSDIIVESVWAFTASTKKIGEHIKFSNGETLNKIYGNGRNVMIVMGHFGSWEIYSGMPNLKEKYNLNIDNKDYTYVYKKMHSKVADMVIKRIREKHHSCSLIESQSILRYIIKNRDGKRIFYFIADQSPESGSNFVVNFLNQPTKFIEGAEYIAKRTGMPVFYFSSNRTKRGYYTGDYQLICEDASKCEDGFVTKELARLLEQSIISNPSTWLWSHRRWKEII